MLSRAIQTFSLAQKQFCWSGVGVRTTETADRNMAAHRHSFFQIFFVARGRAMHEIGDRIFQAESGSIFFVRPYTIHRVVFPEDSECYVIYFSAQFLQGTATLNGEAAPQDVELYRLPELAPFVYQAFCSYKLEAAEIGEARARCLQMADACSLRGIFDASRARAELTLLLTLVGKKYLTEFKRFEQAVEGADHYIDKRAKAAIAYVKRNFNKNLALSDVARTVNLTGTYLTHLLKQETGKSFKQLLDEFRLQNSKNLLAYTDEPLQRIATESGFLDQAHFSKRFKAHENLTPGQFRKRHHSLMASDDSRDADITTDANTAS